jgi:hypothetical protein
MPSPTPRPATLTTAAAAALTLLAGCLSAPPAPRAAAELQPESDADTATPAADAATPETENETAPEPHTIADTAFLAGAWRGEALGGIATELVLPPDAGAMTAVFRLNRDGRIAFYEFILIEQTGDGVQMLIHHFDPGMSRWEDDPVAFDLIEASDDAAVFAERSDAEENTLLRYTRDGDELLAELVNRAGDTESVTPFRYERVDPADLFDND